MIGLFILWLKILLVKPLDDCMHSAPESWLTYY